MKKDEAISILATSQRPREPKDRARYDEAVEMAIEALSCSEFPNNSDTISRQQAIDTVEFGITYAKAINKETVEVRELFKQSNEELRKAVERIKQLPSVQPERKTGHWVYRPEWSKYGDVWSCSECGEKTSQSVMGEPRFKYCPMCGAKMESVGEQE